MSRFIVKDWGSEIIHDPKQPQDVPTTPENYLARFRENFEMNILERPSPNEMVFELIHVDTSFVNALRRILLSEVSTVAIESVYISRNSSIIHDEVLAHRLGLVPLMVDARLMEEFRDPELTEGGEAVQDDDDMETGPNDRNTIVFRLAVSCAHAEARAAAASSSGKTTTRKGGQPKNDDAEDVAMDEDIDPVVQADEELEQIAKEAASKQPYQFPKDRPFTKHVYSGDLEWIPQGEQADRFTGDELPRPIYGDILLAKLRPGQSIELEAHARKGIGKDHAKYSPVSTASYRLLPHVEILQPIYDDVAEELVHIYEPGVFELVPTTSEDPPGTRQKAVVKNHYACTMSRNFMRHEVLAKSIKITRITDHFIFSIETVGMYSPPVLLAEALRVLQRKCQRVMDLAESAVQPE